MIDIDALLTDAVARASVRQVTLAPVGAQENRMWQAAVRYSGSDGWRVAIEATPSAAIAAAISSVLRTEASPALEDLFG